MLFIEEINEDHISPSTITRIQQNHTQGFRLRNGNLVRVLKGPDRCYFGQWDSLDDYRVKPPTKEWTVLTSSYPQSR